MRFSESWLREWVDPDVDTSALVAQLTMAGLEVDAVEPAAPDFTGVVVGEVRSVEALANTDKLRLCRVETGAGEPLQIVCGAANVAAGMKVPTATIGARLPGDFKIKRAKLRGVESSGMICSAAELGLAESSDGIMPLPPDAPLGEDVRTYLNLSDRCVELDLTPDRADCLSLAGIAREVGVINRCPVHRPPIEPVPPSIEDRFNVILETPDACPSYACRIIRGIDRTVTTPLWMRERLRRSAVRSISPVVDVTNYVLLELGQPMHGFDLARLDSEIRVRLAAQGERLSLLNGEQIELRDDTLVIADRQRPVALAGIMGGCETAVEGHTRDILLESAFFAPAAVSGKARSYGLHTDSSHRFERGVDPQLQVTAIERATALLLDIVDGEPGPITVASSKENLPRPVSLLLRRQRIRKLLGVEPPDHMVEDILSRLGMELTAVPEGWTLIPPTARFDLTIEEDLIAEIGRIYGYERIPVTHASSAIITKSPPEAAFDLNRAKLALISRGYHEVITYSFVSPELQRRIYPPRKALTLANPISADMSVMRLGLWPGLLQAARQNQARQRERVRIFESGLRFLPEDNGLEQDMVLAGLVVGSVVPEQWGAPARAGDFFDAKADLQDVLRLTGDLDQFRFVAAEHPALHPGQSANIRRDGRDAGWLGMLHPSLAADLDIKGDAFVFEIALSALEPGRLPQFSALSKFPAIRRDLALVVGAEVTYDQLRLCICEAASDWLRGLILFDVYLGQEIDSGRKSLALGLILQASSQTLTDQEVERIVSRVLTRLGDDLGAKLRD